MAKTAAEIQREYRARQAAKQAAAVEAVSERLVQLEDVYRNMRHIILDRRTPVLEQLKMLRSIVEATDGAGAFETGSRSEAGAGAAGA